MWRLTAQPDDFRWWLAVSAGTHLVLFILSLIALPVLFRPLPSPPVYVPVEIVELGPITNTRKRSEPETPQPPAPQEKPQPPAPAAPAEAAPPEPTIKAEPLPDETPKPQEPEKPKADPLANILQNVASLKDVAPAAPGSVLLPDRTPQEAAAPAGPALADRLTISEEDALRRQMQQCWNVPIGAPNPETLIVDVRLQIGPDRVVRRAEIVDQRRYNSDPFFRAAAEAALRAVFNPRCSPLMLPPDGYDTWQNLVFTFDPRDAL